jgi:two-component system, OmpR family, phosphate regulon sensor histidine kinase PhoR
MYPLIISLLLIVILGLFVYATRLREEQEMMRHELRRVLEAGAGRVEDQDTELSWRRALCNLSPLAILVTDHHKEVLYVNPTARRLFGPVQTGEAAIARVRQHRLDEMLDTALETGQAGPDVVTLRDKLFLVHAAGWSHSATDHGAFLMLEDVTELRRLARARREMVSNLSHELRTPLTSIKLMTESLLAGGLNDEQLERKLVGRIATENDALIRLVEDLTILSGIESGRMPLTLERVNLREVVEMRLQRLEAQRASRGLCFRMESPEAPVVELDRERFGQVLTNLLDNAIKFSPEDGTIHISIEEHSNQTVLTIEDEGPGIAPHELPRIFERFYKGDRARTRSDAGGTGLGLAIVKHLVEAHGGAITALSPPGHGAVFRITLPRG